MSHLQRNSVIGRKLPGRVVTSRRTRTNEQRRTKLTDLVFGIICGAGIGAWGFDLAASLPIFFSSSEAERGWASLIVLFGFLGGSLPGAVIGGIIGTTHAAKHRAATIGGVIGVLVASYFIILDPAALLFGFVYMITGAAIGWSVAWVIGS